VHQSRRKEEWHLRQKKRRGSGTRGGLQGRVYICGYSNCHVEFTGRTIDNIGAETSNAYLSLGFPKSMTITLDATTQ
jgi:hypothetical protein